MSPICGFTHLSCISKHKNNIKKSFVKEKKFKNGNLVLVHISTETIFGTYSRNCTCKSLANRYFKSLPLKSFIHEDSSFCIHFNAWLES